MCVFDTRGQNYTEACSGCLALLAAFGTMPLITCLKGFSATYCDMITDRLWRYAADLPKAFLYLVTLSFSINFLLTMLLQSNATPCVN